MSKRHKVTISKTVRLQTPEEQARFMAAIDLLIAELVEQELDRRERERSPRSDALPSSFKPDNNAMREISGE
jgi:hypothetical protein